MALRQSRMGKINFSLNKMIIWLLLILCICSSVSSGVMVWNQGRECGINWKLSKFVDQTKVVFRDCFN